MIQLYTGEGKGKTTAAIGQAIRAAGSGYKVIFSQFMKGNDTGELHVLQNIPGITICRSDRTFGFYSTLSDEEKHALTDIHNSILDTLLEAAERHSCQMIVLDEITYPVKWGLLDTDKLKRLLLFAEERRDGKSDDSTMVMEAGVELVLTGRDAMEFMKDNADYITEMKCLRHPYEKGIAARRGIEY